MPSVKSLQLMARVFFDDGVVAMVQCPAEELNPQLGPALPDPREDQSPKLLAALRTQYAAIAEYAELLHADGIYQQAVSEAAARREQVEGQAEEAEQRMRIGARKRTATTTEQPQDGAAAARDGGAAVMTTAELAEGPAGR